MEIPTLLKGGLVGFCLAVPLGPVNVLCMRRTLTHGRASGLASGLGAALADGIYGGIAGFGVQFAAQAILESQIWLRLLGGALLCYLGYRSFAAKPAQVVATNSHNGVVGDVLSTFLLTLTNPMTIISFAAVFAAMGISKEEGGVAGASLLVVGVFLGSMSWWTVLAWIVGLFRGKMGSVGLLWANRISGLVIAGFGLASMLSFRL
ncbi:MAG: LysE family translocator [Thermodesulfobacteriota bacterium]